MSGFGHIGKLVAQYANLMGMKVLVNDPPLNNVNFEFPDYVEYEELDVICSKSDILTNHVPFTVKGKYATKNLLDFNVISQLRKNALLIHTSRGEIVNEEALLKCIHDNPIEAVVDVWENEPTINIELAKKSFLCTPHIAGYSLDGKIKGVMQMIDAYELFKGDKFDLTSINFLLSSYHPLLPEQYHDYESLFKLLKQSRKLDDDHYNLMYSLKLPKNEKAFAFDKLRKNYPMRREIL
ncbi:MAG: NAD(P)-dependent oxidoreductase [FCB group bacterium]